MDKEIQITGQTCFFSKKQLEHALDCASPLAVSVDLYCYHGHIDQLYAAVGYADLMLPDYLKQASFKRQKEFIAGRLLAQAILWRHYGCTDQITDELHRLPQWPEPILGCISHTDTQVVVALGQAIQYLGIDLECYLSHDLAEVQQLIVHPQERVIFQKCVDHYDLQTALTLLFSMKESLYKAIYPKVCRYVDFLQARLLEVNFEQGLVQMVLDDDIVRQYMLEACYSGAWKMSQHDVLTWMVSKGDP